MAASRSRALKLNMISGWLLELVAVISGLILPRLMLLHFGSEINGLVNSIVQFLGFSTVLRAGLGGVTRAALYKPLAEGNTEEISGIMVATRSYMQKIALIIAAYILILATAYAFLIRSEFKWEFVFSLVLIVGTSTFVENFFSVKAQILLQADQKYYVQTLCTVVSYLAAFLVSVALIYAGANVMLVKIGATMTSFISPVLLNVYVKKHYRLNMKASPNQLAIKQRWDAFAHQLSVIVNDNVAVILLTFFVSLKEISVYTIYNMIVVNVKKLVQACVTGINSTFGDMIARGEEKELKKTFFFTEWAFFSLSTIIFSVTAIMIVPFVRIYTDSVTDVNYIRPLFSVLIAGVGLGACFRVPYQMLVEAAGHFKQTRNGAIIEVLVNIVLSAILAHFFGIVGVILGSIIASLIRTLEFALYATRKVIKVSPAHLFRTLLLYAVTFVGMILLGRMVPFPENLNYLTWCLWAAAVTVCVTIIVLVIGIIFNWEQIKQLFLKIFKRRNKEKR